MRANSLGNNGTGGKTASAHSPDIKIDNAPAGGHDFPWDEIDKRTISHCEKIFGEQFEKTKEQLKQDIDRILRHMNILVKYLVSPLLGLIFTGSLFIFSLMYNQLSNLNIAVQSLNQTMAALAQNIKSMERESDDNKRAIEKMQDRMYK